MLAAARRWLWKPRAYFTVEEPNHRHRRLAVILNSQRRSPLTPLRALCSADGPAPGTPPSSARGAVHARGSHAHPLRWEQRPKAGWSGPGRPGCAEGSGTGEGAEVAPLQAPHRGNPELETKTKARARGALGPRGPVGVAGLCVSPPDHARLVRGSPAFLHLGPRGGGRGRWCRQVHRAWGPWPLAEEKPPSPVLPPAPPQHPVASPPAPVLPAPQPEPARSRPGLRRESPPPSRPPPSLLPCPIPRTRLPLPQALDNAHRSPALTPLPPRSPRALIGRGPAVQPPGRSRDPEHYVSRAGPRPRAGDWGARVGGAACAVRPSLPP